MIFGHNTNVKSGGATYHVQTEDRGTASALIETTVYGNGQVVHRKAGHYADLLPLDERREGALKKRLDEQHVQVVEAIRSGALRLAAAPAAPAHAVKVPRRARALLSLKLTNENAWLSGRRASLQISVRDASGDAVAGARVVARVEGASAPAEHAGESDAAGQARLEFDLPKMNDAAGALIVEASRGAAAGRLRFQLRARPRVPVA